MKRIEERQISMAIHAEAKVDLPARKEEQVKDSDEKKEKKDKEGRKEKGKKDRNPPMLREDWAQDIGY